MSRRQVLTHILDALSDVQSLERNGNSLQLIVTQLGYANINVTEDQVRQALDQVCEQHPSTFVPMPEASVQQGAHGLVYRIRRSERKEQARHCITQVYKVTDQLQRTMVEVSCGPTGGPFGPFSSPQRTCHIETLRPRAFAICMGKLRVRWAKGNFRVPSPHVIHRWFEKHPSFVEMNQTV